eukprot:s1495_g7.t1
MYLGTKPLGGQRVQLLVHELCIAYGDGSGLVGQHEFDEQRAKHGNGKQVAKLAKSIAEILLVSGLGSSSLRQCFQIPRCVSEPNTIVQGEASWMSVFAMLFMLILIGFTMYMFKRVKDLIESFDKPYTDIAVLESLAEKLDKENKGLTIEVNGLQERFCRVPQAHNELEGQDEMLSVSLDGVHYGLIMLGGYNVL